MLTVISVLSVPFLSTWLYPQVKYHEEFEKSKGAYTAVADDPETSRVKGLSSVISPNAYSGGGGGGGGGGGTSTSFYKDVYIWGGLTFLMHVYCEILEVSFKDITGNYKIDRQMTFTCYTVEITCSVSLSNPRLY